MRWTDGLVIGHGAPDPLFVAIILVIFGSIVAVPVVFIVSFLKLRAEIKDSLQQLHDVQKRLILEQENLAGIVSKMKKHDEAI